MAAPAALRPADDDLFAALAGRRLPRWSVPAAMAGAVVLALALNATTGVDGVAGTTVVAVLAYAALQTGWSFAVEGRRHAVDRLATTAVYGTFLGAIVPLVAVLAVVVSNGMRAFDVGFLTHSMRNVSPLVEGGGLYHAVVGTLQQVAVATVVAVPVGVLAAVYLVEYGRGRLALGVSFFVDVMTGVPSIVAGLFIYTFWVLTLGFSRSGFAGSLALTILMIPVIVRTTEEMLRIVPNELREASYALGVPKWRTILKVVLPTALSGIITGVMLAVARVAGETAPLLLTTTLSQSINFNPFAGGQASVPTFVWNEIASGTGPSVDRAWAGALVLVGLVAVFYLGARLLARAFAPRRR